MNGPRLEVGADFNAGDKLNPRLVGRGSPFDKTRQGVVIGDGDRARSGGGREPN